MATTTIATWLNQERVGYWVGCFLSPEQQQVVAALQTALSRELPGLLWLTPPQRLHVTLFEIIMPLRDYPLDKDQLFAAHHDEIAWNLDVLFRRQPPIRIDFNAVAASPETIIITGTDDGSFERWRAEAVARPIIQQGSRTPPDIIHSSIARYVQSADLDTVRSTVAKHAVHFQETVRSLSLCRIFRTPMECEVLHEYALEQV